MTSGASTKPVASISLDLDNLWSYMKTRGDEGWRQRPTYIPTFVPMILDALDELEIKITFFLVGADATIDENRPYLRRLVDAGHEIGNHTFEHEVWLHSYDEPKLNDELGRAEVAISDATGQMPRGFRGPGFSWSPLLLETLIERGYLFDASTLPTFIGPLARWYYFRNTDFDDEQSEQRDTLFGPLSEGLRPNGPYLWTKPDGAHLLEIPVTTTPIVRTPFHLSYLIYLSKISPLAMLTYLRTALTLCRMARVGPSLLLHPLDLLSGEDAPELKFFPGMDLPATRKRELFITALGEITKRFDVVPMNEHASQILERNDLSQKLLISTAHAN
jgi:hypothetical protein